MFSCSHGGRLCVCGHIKAQHVGGLLTCVDCAKTRRGYGGQSCDHFDDRAPETAPKEYLVHNERGIEAKRIWP